MKEGDLQSRGTYVPGFCTYLTLDTGHWSFWLQYQVYTGTGYWRFAEDKYYLVLNTGKYTRVSIDSQVSDELGKH